MKTECDQCGTCCAKGGPALHVEDISLIRSGLLSIDDLVTIREGEIVLQSDTGKPETTEVELIKIQGLGGDWCCRFLDPGTRTCTVYENRPLACRLLECWNPDAALEISGKKLLSRFDIIAADDPLLELLRFYDQQLALPDMVEVRVRLNSEEQRESTLAELREQVERDLLFRALAVDRFAFPVERELFYFGRPLFHLLAPLGVAMTESPEGIALHFEEQ
ncbi:MAG: YkgJ family cysteine cluster protein [Desulfobulbaceae bacterium]|jgi:Fe-S-cluster containining protein|nr:YkgJ family cysteine cluster protein [Desulfobulbaceae bacterium]